MTTEINVRVLVFYIKAFGNFKSKKLPKKKMTKVSICDVFSNCIKQEKKIYNSEKLKLLPAYIKKFCKN